MDLSTKYLGLDLANPLVAGASPLSDDVDAVRRLEDAGASAIVMHSLFMEQIAREERYGQDHVDAHTHSHAEALTYLPGPATFALGPDEYLEHVARLKRATSIPVFGSLNGVTAGPWTRYAERIAEAGADGIELNVYHLPLEGDEDSATVEQRFLDVLASVRSRVRVPVAVKLTWFFSSPVHMARRLAQAGADGIVLFNPVFFPDIDAEALELKPTLHLSSPSDLRARLQWVAAMFGKVPASLAVTGGVHDASGVIRAVMAGADVTQLTTSLLERGPHHVGRIRRELTEWLEDHGYEALSQMRGSMSLQRCPDPDGYERASYLRTLTSWRAAPETSRAAPRSRAPRAGGLGDARERAHQDLAQLLDRLEAAVAPEAARAVLEEITGFLPGHFAEEEDIDGTFDWVCALAPHLGERVQELQEDHRALLAELHGAADSLERTRRLGELLRDHERRERQLVIEAVGAEPPPRPFPF